MPAKKKQNPFALIMPLLEDPEVTEIMIDGTERITIEKLGTFEDTDLRFGSDEDIKAVVRESLKMAGTELEEDKTVYDVRFDDNSRMIAVLSPTSIHGHSVIFRKWMRNQISWTLFFICLSENVLLTVRSLTQYFAPLITLALE